MGNARQKGLGVTCFRNLVISQMVASSTKQNLENHQITGVLKEKLNMEIPNKKLRTFS